MCGCGCVGVCVGEGGDQEVGREGVVIKAHSQVAEEEDRTSREW